MFVTLCGKFLAQVWHIYGRFLGKVLSDQATWHTGVWWNFKFLGEVPWDQATWHTGIWWNFWVKCYGIKQNSVPVYGGIRKEEVRTRRRGRRGG